MKKTIILLSIILIFSVSLACIAQDTDIALKTSTVAVLKTTLRSLNLKNPESDLDINFKNNDYRYICLYGYACYTPGVESTKMREIDPMEMRCLDGTSDAIESSEHKILIGQAEKYAETYNKLLLEKLRKNP